MTEATDPPVEDEPQAADKPRKKKRWPRRVAVALLLLLILAVGVLLGAPRLLSSAPGRRIVLGQANKRIAGSIKIGSLRLSWTGGQSIKDFELHDVEGRKALAFQEFSADATLLGLLRRRADVGTVLLAGLEADLKLDESGRMNLLQALAPAEPPSPASAPKRPGPGKSPDEPTEPARVPIDLAALFELQDASIRIDVPGRPPVQVSDLNATVGLKSIDQPIEMSLSAQTEQESLSGALTLEGAVSDLFDAVGRVQPDKARANLKASTSGLPVDGIDQFLGAAGLLRAALGPQLDLSLESAASPDKTQIVLKAQSQNLSSDLAVELQGKALSLSRRGRLSLALTPALLDALSPAAKEQYRLLRKATVEVTLDELSAPLGALDLDATAVRAAITLEDVELTGPPPLGPLALRGFQATFNSPSLSRGARFDLSGAVERDGQANQVNLQGAVQDWLDKSGQPRLDAMQADLEASVADFPLGLIDQIARLDGLLVEALGPKLNAKAVAAGSAAGQTVSLTAQSERLTLELPMTIGETLALSAPGQVNFTLTPSLLERVSPPGSAIRLTEPTAVELSLNRLSAPRPKDGASASEIRPESIELDASLFVDPLKLTGLPEIGAATISDLVARIGGPSLAAVEIVGSALIVPSNDSALAAAALGPQTKVALYAKGSAAGPSGLELPTIQLQVAGENLAVALQGRFSERGDRVALIQPATAQFTLTPALLSHFLPQDGQQATLAAPASIQLTVQPFESPVAAFSLGQLHLKATLAAPELALAGDPKLQGIIVRNLAANLDFNGQANSASVLVKGRIKSPDRPNPALLNAEIKAAGLLKDGLLNPALGPVRVSADLEKFPLALAEAFTAGETSLVALLGPALTANIKAEIADVSKPSKSLDLKAENGRLALDAGLALGEQLELSRPATLNYTMTPEAFAVLVPPPPPIEGQGPPARLLNLASNATIKAQIDSLHLPMKTRAEEPGPAIDLANASFQANVSLPQLALTVPESNQTTRLERLQAAIGCAAPGEPITLKLTGEVAGDKDVKPGAIQVSCQVADLFNDDGTLNVATLSTQIQASLTSMPVAPLDGAAAARGALLALTGEALDLDLNASLQAMRGPLDLNLTSPGVWGRLESSFSPGAMSLRNPLRAEMVLTPALSQIMLRRINPLLVTAAGAANPLRLTVSRDGFLLPTAPPILPRLAISHAEIDLGTVFLNNGGVLKGLLQVLGVEAGAQVNAKFTPIKARLQDGVAVYERVEILIADQVKISTKGVIDLVHDQVDMQIEVPAETLQQTAGLKDLKSRDYLVIPMSGPTAKVTVDWTRAARELGLLAVRSQMSERIPGEAGQIMEGLMGGRLTRPGADPTPTPQTQQPGGQPPPAEQEKGETKEIEDLLRSLAR
jgi:hypothetical protein